MRKQKNMMCIRGTINVLFSGDPTNGCLSPAIIFGLRYAADVVTRISRKR